MDKKSPKESEEAKAGHDRASQFDFVAGNACLDFVNTLDDRYTKPKEGLHTYADLARFVAESGLLDISQADALIKRSSMSPDQGRKVLASAKELREAIHDVFWAIIHHRSARRTALAQLNASIQAAAGHLRLKEVDGLFVWQFEDEGRLDSILWPLARSAGELLVSHELEFVRACASESCQWFFLDTSKNHQRRWCDMTRCGNRAKVQRFYLRQKTGS
jgi:predicted RNA-binding Zn ribbon-like protein